MWYLWNNTVLSALPASMIQMIAYNSVSYKYCWYHQCADVADRKYYISHNRFPLLYIDGELAILQTGQIRGYPWWQTASGLCLFRFDATYSWGISSNPRYLYGNTNRGLSYGALTGGTDATIGDAWGSKFSSNPYTKTALPPSFANGYYYYTKYGDVASLPYKVVTWAAPSPEYEFSTSQYGEYSGGTVIGWRIFRDNNTVLSDVFTETLPEVNGKTYFENFGYDPTYKLWYDSISDKYIINTTLGIIVAGQHYWESSTLKGAYIFVQNGDVVTLGNLNIQVSSPAYSGTGYMLENAGYIAQAAVARVTMGDWV